MVDLKSKPIQVKHHVIKRVRERSKHHISRSFPDISVINDVKHNAIAFARVKRKGKFEIRLFSKGRRQYRIVEENDSLIVITMIQHNEDSFKRSWRKYYGRKVILDQDEANFLLY